MNGITHGAKVDPLRLPTGFYSSLRKKKAESNSTTKVDRATSPIFDAKGNLLWLHQGSVSVLDFIAKTNFDASDASDLCKLCRLLSNMPPLSQGRETKQLQYEILKKITQFSLQEISQLTLDLSKINLLDKGLTYAISNQVVAKQADLSREQFSQILSTFEKIKFTNVDFFIKMSKFVLEQIQKPDCPGEELTQFASAYAFQMHNSQNDGVLKSQAGTIWLEIQKKDLELSLPPSTVQLFEDTLHTLNSNSLKNQLMTADDPGLIFHLCEENHLDTDLLVTALKRLAILNKPVPVRHTEVFNTLVMNGMNLLLQMNLYADHLCDLGYALVRLGEYDEDMLSRVESRALALVSTFNAQHFGDITGALCQSKFPKRKFFTTIAPLIPKQLRTATDIDLAKIAIAYEVLQQNSSVSYSILSEIDRREMKGEIIDMALESASANLKGLKEEEVSNLRK